MEEGVQLLRIRETSVVQDLGHDGPHPRLLPVDSVEISIGQCLTFTRIGQGLLAIKHLRAGIEICSCQVLRSLQIDRHTTDLVSQSLERLEVGHYEVVDANTRELLNGLDRQSRPAVRICRVDLGLPMTGNIHPGITRYGHHGHALPIPTDLHDHDRIGTLGADLPLRGITRTDTRIRPEHQEVRGRLLPLLNRLLRGARGQACERIGEGLHIAAQRMPDPQAGSSGSHNQEQNQPQHREQGDLPSTTEPTRRSGISGG